MNRQIHLLTAVSLTLALCSGFVVLDPSARAGASSSVLAAQPDYAAIDSYVAGQVRDLRVPGLALGIVHDNQIVHLQSFGVAGSDGTAVTSQTPFMLGSSSKSFTALAIMQLVEAGKIRLDAPVQAYVPWFRVADPDASSRITVRNLLNHTSGLPTLADADQQERDTSAGAPETSVRRLSSVQLDRPVRTTYEYANANYMTLGLIVQVVSGQPYETYVHEHIFAPLGMTHSYTSGSEAAEHGLATGYRYWFQFPVAAPGLYLNYNRSHAPAGLLVSSAEDMTHYLIAQLNDGAYAGKRILSAVGVEQMHSPAVKMDEAAQYAMGWMVADVNGVHIVTHAGDLAAGYHADMVLIPNDGRGRWGIIVLTNANSMLAPVATKLKGVAWGVVSRITGRQIPPAQPNYLQYWLSMGFGTTLLLAMLARLVWSARNALHWRRVPAERPVEGKLWAWRVGLPLLWDLGVVVLFLLGLPIIASVPLSNLEFWQPDLVWLYALSFLVAVIWGPIRTLLTALALRPRPVSPTLKARLPARAPVN